MEKTKRYLSVDIVKGIAMIAVILVHYGQNFNVGVARAFDFLSMGCAMFFVASGFSMMCFINNKFNNELNKSNIKKFYILRFKSLAPGWYSIIAIIFLVNTVLLLLRGRMLTFGTNRSFLAIIGNILFLNGLLPFCNNNVVPGGWYIGATAILYLLTPLILKMINKNRYLFFGISSMAAIVIYTILLRIFPNLFGDGFKYTFFLIYYPEYLLGIILYFNFNSISAVKAKIYEILSAIILVSAVFIYYIGGSLVISILSSWLVSLSTYLFLYFALSVEQKKEFKKFTKIFEKYGKNSYYIYLSHAFIVWPFVRMCLSLSRKIGITENFIFYILIPLIIFLSYVLGMLLQKNVKLILRLGACIKMHVAKLK